MSNINVRDVVQEDAMIFQVRIAAEYDPAKIASLGRGSYAVGVSADRVVVERTHPNRHRWRPENLNGGRGAAEVYRRSARIQIGGAQLDQHASIERHCNALRHQELRTIAKRVARCIGSQQIGAVVGCGQDIVIKTAVADDTNQVRCIKQSGRVSDIQAIQTGQVDDPAICHRGRR